MIYGDIREQNLMLRVNAVADTIDYLTARFIFHTADWDNLIIYAHFKQGDTIYSVQLTDGKITEADHLNLGAGEWELYLHGNEYKNGDVIKRITTNIQKFVVEPTGVLNGEPFPEAEPSIVEELLAETSDHENRIDVLEDVVDKEVKSVSIGSGSRLIATGQEVYDTYYHTGTNNLTNGPYRVLRMRINQQDNLLEFWGIRRISDVSESRIDISKFTAPLDGEAVRRVANTHAIPTWDEYQKLVNEGEVAEGDTGYVTGGAVYSALTAKQDTLTAGTNITIENNVISATGGGASVQSDWNQNDSTAPDYIKNKPDLSVYAETEDLSDVATSGDYADLSNKPDLSVYAESADLASVATSGSYADLANTPTIPSDAEDIDYDNTDSGLTATDVQAAIDELAQGGGGFVVSDTAPSDTGVLWIDPSDDTTFPAGTNVGDLLVWNGTEWVAQTPEKPSRLPIGYQEVEYVEGTGTQYIDTGYVPKLTTKWELTWRAINGDSNLECRNGRHGGGDGERFSIAAASFNLSDPAAANNIDFGIGGYFATSFKYTTTENNNTKSKTILLKKITCVIDASNMSYEVEEGLFNGTISATLTFASQQTLYLMARNTANGFDGCGVSRIYSHKIWENGTKVQEFVPCYRKADGVIGMYDLVTDTFYTNAGTGTFTKGADV